MQGAMLPLLLVLHASEIQLCRAHGKLTKPTPRDGISTGRAGLDQNNPVSFEPGCSKENACDAFVCREAAPNPNVPVTVVSAGQPLQLMWSFTALHVGDCSVYISYDLDKPRSQQKFVKIANIPDCKKYTSWNIEIPASLPAGRAILRWDWVALHIWPKTENFVQCSDIEIRSASSSRPSELDSFSITNPPIYPDDGNDGVGFRNAFGPGSQDMTGPSCIDDSINECMLTAPGTPRNTDSRRGSGGPRPSPQQPGPAPGLPAPGPQPVPAPQPQPEPVPQPQPQPQPAPALPTPPAGDCVSSGDASYTLACASLAANCELFSFCRRAASGGGAPAPPPPSAGACVSSDPVIDYSAACKVLEACEQYSFCKRAPSLGQLSVAHSTGVNKLRHRSMSHNRVLLQQGAIVQQGAPADTERWGGIESVISHGEL